MRTVLALLSTVCLCAAAPFDMAPRASFSGEAFIVGGADAQMGVWDWQLSQERNSGAWSHSCGASLFSATYGMTAAHCMDGAAPQVLRVIAGVYDRSNLQGAQIANIASYKMHEDYNIGPGTFSDDIAIMTFATSITIGGDVQPLTLPADNSNNFDGDTCTITGWGRTSASNILPMILQQADIGIIGTARCQQLMTGVAGVLVLDSHICLYDETQMTGSCNGDSGGPLNCVNPAGGHIVAGVTSWGIQSAGRCLQTYPSVYTRTSSFLDWIATNTP